MFLSSFRVLSSCKTQHFMSHETSGGFMHCRPWANSIILSWANGVILSWAKGIKLAWAKGIILSWAKGIIFSWAVSKLVGLILQYSLDLR